MGSWSEVYQPLLPLTKSMILYSPIPAPRAPAIRLCTWGRNPSRIQLTHITVTGCVLYCFLDLEKTESAKARPACERFLFLRKRTGQRSASREQRTPKGQHLLESSCLRASPVSCSAGRGLRAAHWWLKQELGGVIHVLALVELVGGEGASSQPGSSGRSRTLCCPQHSP